MIKRRIFPVFLALLIVVVGVRILTYISQPPSTLGVRNGRLAKPPGSPNCVSSQIPSDKTEYVKPLPLPPIGENAIATLAEKTSTMSGANIVTQDQDYLHVEFRSLVFGFVDDVEFFVNKEDNVIDVRSASRMGYSDLGSNRNRVERIRRLWADGS